MEVKFQKGQAAITDALFTLLIISSLCLMLYSFAATYGSDIMTHFLRQYAVDYATDSLRTFLYCSAARQPDLNLNEDGAIPDHTLVLLKEAYFEMKVAQNGEFDINRVKTFISTLETIMQPIADQFDYMLIFTSTPEEGVYNNYLAIIRSAEFTCYKDKSKTVEIDCTAEDRNVTIEPIGYKFLVCKDISDASLRNFMLYVGDSATATSPVLLPISKNDIGFGYITLIIWPSTLLDENFLSSEEGMNCKTPEEYE